MMGLCGGIVIVALRVAYTGGHHNGFFLLWYCVCFFFSPLNPSPVFARGDSDAEAAAAGRGRGGRRCRRRAHVWDIYIYIYSGGIALSRTAS